MAEVGNIKMDAEGIVYADPHSIEVGTNSKGDVVVKSLKVRFSDALDSSLLVQRFVLAERACILAQLACAGELSKRLNEIAALLTNPANEQDSDEEIFEKLSQAQASA
ncbi:MAG: hypothetical protein ACYDCC_04685 [Actinomycetota bacterium]